ncbi:hypothetical protein KS4_26440 [Poriferisphaera corsica]|uniref:Prepilin-type N-terminal cleavage/methylation domain-containing protein n=1 Tax=Poriferisphaera corsica TaxID=2528020 RepID=A0A517YWH8_9BACT|nr:type II secretion system protein [Poriferisphaera corsica]QDU34574.1 hypothetical protein KS4_26440 [Poriferisphaera corsica]
MRNGFTLIELLVTVVIAGLLMASVMQVIGTLGRTSRLIEERLDYTYESWRERLVDQIKRDLQHVTSIQHVQDKLILETLGCYNPETMKWKYLPTRVTYYAEFVNDIGVFIREQQLLLDSESKQKLKQIMALSIEEFIVKPVSLDDDMTRERFVVELKLAQEEEVLLVPCVFPMKNQGGVSGE